MQSPSESVNFQQGEGFPVQNAQKKVPNKKGRRASMNCTPFVRQYGILFRKWGVFVCQRDNESTTELKR